MARLGEGLGGSSLKSPYLAKLLSLTASILALGLAGASPAAAAPADSPRITIALLTPKTGVKELSRVPGTALGLLGAGIGLVPPAQTYLDLGQGNRVAESLYEQDLPRLRPRVGSGVPATAWRHVVERALAVPGDLVPGSFASTLADAGIPIRTTRDAGLASLIAADRSGAIRLARCQPGRCRGVLVTGAAIEELPGLVGRLRRDDLLLAIQTPPPEGSSTLAFAVAGRGFAGSLTSPSTRIEGLVAATDVPVTVLDRLDVGVPDEMNGAELRSEGEADHRALVALQDRLQEKGGRRAVVVGLTVLVWCLLAALAARLTRGAARRAVVALVALAVVYLPLVQLLTGAIAPSQGLEHLLVGLGAPLLAAATHAALRGWRALGFACAATVGAFIVDLVAGLDLIQLSILGPNVAAGGRFFGINNEIEAIAGALVPIGTGALLATRPTTRHGGTAAVAGFLLAGLVAGAVFAVGRLGADVGAAIVLPAGAAAAAAVATKSRRGVVFVLLAPLAGLVGLVVADTLLGGGAHFTSTVIEAGSFAEVLDAIQRKLVLAAKSFLRASNLVVLPIALALIAAGVVRRHSIREWIGERAALAGFVGAATATAIGTVTNDSGAVILIFGTACIAACVGFAWSLRDPATAPSTEPRVPGFAGPG